MFKERIHAYEEEFLRDLEELVAKESVRDQSSAGSHAPFGTGIRDAFDCFLRIAEKCGLETEDCDGYACHAALGTDGEYVGVLGHLDVVEPGNIKEWRTPPFAMSRDGDMLYGRGVNDDKGPLLAALYAVRILKDMNIPLRRSIRVIAGGAEETTWECMKHYFAGHSQPAAGFSPDGNFPIVNGEKGIRKYDLFFEKEKTLGNCRLLAVDCPVTENYVCGQLTIRYEQNGREQTAHWEGKRCLSRNPQRGENVLWNFAEDFGDRSFVQGEVNRLLIFLKECMTGDYYGEKSGLYVSDDEMGTTSVCPTGICMDEKNGGIHLYLDIRYPRSTGPDKLDSRLFELARQYGFSVKVTQEKRLLYVPEDSELIRVLKGAYESVTGEKAFVLTKGGASYARTLDFGVAFGATFEGEDTRPHMPDECMSLSSLQKATEIYCEALYGLAADVSFCHNNGE